MSDELLQDIARKLDIIIRLLLKESISEINKIEATKLCSDIGLTNSEIANIFDIEPNVVSARLSEAKKDKK